MDNKTKILAIEDELIYQELLQAVFADYQFRFAASGEEGLKLAKDFLPDIILLDINLPKMDGYQTCCALKKEPRTQEIPVIYLSQCHTLKDRLKAYGTGCIDYISKPFDSEEVLLKINKHIETKKAQEQLALELDNSNNVVLDMQLELADIQIIGRFLQSNLFCRDFNSLFELFFKTTKELDISCILQIKDSNENILRSDNNNISRLEKEIISMSDAMDRIQSFGEDRAMFNWSNANLLVRNLGTRIDLLAILMNGLDASIQVICSEHKLLAMISELELENKILKDEISDLFAEMSISLQDTFLSLGMVSSLEPEEEDKLNDQVDKYRIKVDQRLSLLSKNNAKITQLINEMRNPVESEQKQQESAVVDSIDFF